MDIRIVPHATGKERMDRYRTLMARRQQGMEVGGFAQTFWMLAVGLNYNEAALKDLLNICLDNPLPQWEVEGLEILDFWGFVRYLQGRSQWAIPGQSEPFCRDFPTTSILQTPTKRRRVRRRTGKPTPEPAPVRELTEPSPEPAPVRELTEPSPEPAPAGELTEPSPESAPAGELTGTVAEQSGSPVAAVEADTKLFLLLFS
ncbi:uncharacterized protein LOC107683868, partial [Sinocyclocheilus anshuiensis]|uniref:uncharacterized protein LOC107683868 n=1 Tax=Sinocyclocheilus anshuiensis TaxID=1608454 RepID=UPI0007B7CFD8